MPTQTGMPSRTASAIGRRALQHARGLGLSRCRQACGRFVEFVRGGVCWERGSRHAGAGAQRWNDRQGESHRHHGGHFPPSPNAPRNAKHELGTRLGRLVRSLGADALSYETTRGGLAARFDMDSPRVENQVLTNRKMPNSNLHNVTVYFHWKYP